MNFVNRKSRYESEQTLAQLRSLQEENDRNIKSSLEEVKQFLHSVHQDFESYLGRHKRDMHETNLKINKMTEVTAKTLDNIDMLKDSIEKNSTMIACLLEFSSI